MNRLKLDFALTTNKERAQFIEEYVSSLDFEPNETELDLMAKYILWGKDPRTGLNAVQDGSLELTQKHDEWAKTAAHPTESLDGLIESPAFNEGQIKSLNNTHYTARTSKLSRTEMRKLAAGRQLILDEFESLWNQIDTLDLQIELYELLIGKRTKPIRDNLISKFTSDDIAAFSNLVSDWKQYQYLKKRHLLVDLRRQQYELKDSLSSPVGYGTPTYTSNDMPQYEQTLVWETDIPVWPLGLWDENWERPSYHIQYSCSRNSMEIDLRDEKTMYNLLNLYQDLEESIDRSDLENNTWQLLKTIDWYIEQTDLSNIYAEILKRKLKHEKNIDVAKYVNSTYGKKYTENYISTILTQKIVPKICEAVKFHEMRNENWNKPDMFKTCISCGRTYLKTADFFVRKARSTDGLNNKCKKCDKKIRDERKMIEYIGGKK